MISLSKRLMAIASMVSTTDVVADIGCDHAYIAIYLIENQIAQKVIACDVNKGPLERARENAAVYGVENQIELRLSDGLDKLLEGEANTVVIAGMGGPLIQNILMNGASKIGETTELILQPQSDIGSFRRFLKEEGYKIVSEDMVYEEGKYYPMMKVIKGYMDWTEDTDFEYGKLLIDNGNKVLREYLVHEKKMLEEILLGLNKDSLSERTLERKQELNERLCRNMKAMRYMDEV